MPEIKSFDAKPLFLIQLSCFKQNNLILTMNDLITAVETELYKLLNNW